MSSAYMSLRWMNATSWASRRRSAVSSQDLFFIGGAAGSAAGDTEFANSEEAIEIANTSVKKNNGAHEVR